VGETSIVKYSPVPEVSPSDAIRPRTTQFEWPKWSALAAIEVMPTHPGAHLLISSGRKVAPCLPTAANDSGSGDFMPSNQKTQNFSQKQTAAFGASCLRTAPPVAALSPRAFGDAQGKHLPSLVPHTLSRGFQAQQGTVQQNHLTRSLPRPPNNPAVQVGHASRPVFGLNCPVLRSNSPPQWPGTSGAVHSPFSQKRNVQPVVQSHPFRQASGPASPPGHSAFRDLLSATASMQPTSAPCPLQSCVGMPPRPGHTQINCVQSGSLPNCPSNNPLPYIIPQGYAQSQHIHATSEIPGVIVPATTAKVQYAECDPLSSVMLNNGGSVLVEIPCQHWSGRADARAASNRAICVPRCK